MVSELTLGVIGMNFVLPFMSGLVLMLSVWWFKLTLKNNGDLIVFPMISTVVSLLMGWLSLSHIAEILL